MIEGSSLIVIDDVASGSVTKPKVAPLNNALYEYVICEFPEIDFEIECRWIDRIQISSSNETDRGA